MTSGITKELFGKTDDGKEVYKFAQVNKNGVVLETMSYGAIILGIKCPDKYVFCESVIARLTVKRRDFRHQTRTVKSTAFAGEQPGILKGSGWMLVSRHCQGSFDNFECSRSMWLSGMMEKTVGSCADMRLLTKRVGVATAQSPVQ